MSPPSVPEVPDVAALLREQGQFPYPSCRLIDVDTVVPGKLVVALTDLLADNASPYLWVTAFQRWDNGWFDVLAIDDGITCSRPGGTTIATVSGEAPAGASACRVAWIGTERTRPVVDGRYVVGFFADHDREPGMPTISFA